MGGGFTALVMPSIYQSIMNMGVPSFTAWRWAFFFPGALHVGMTLIVMLFAQDLPDGNYRWGVGGAGGVSGFAIM